MKAFDVNKIPLIIQSPDVKTNAALKDLLIHGIEKLSRIGDRIERFEVVLRSVRNSRNENCEIEMKVTVPGRIHFASVRSNRFGQAARMAFDDLQIQLFKFKELKIQMSNVQIP